jgi:hypothetical protein
MTDNAQIVHETPMPFRLTRSPFLLDDWDAWTLNALLTTSTATGNVLSAGHWTTQRKRHLCCKSKARRDISPLPGFGSGSGMASVAEMSRQCSD